MWLVWMEIRGGAGIHRSGLRRGDCRGRLWQRKEPYEAIYGRLVALDGELARALGVGERPVAPEHCAEGVGVGLNRRAGLIGATAGDLDLIVCHFDPEAILAESQLVGGV